MEQQQILQVLVQEAQQEIGNLRAELYSARRLADERRQALEAVTAARDQLLVVVDQLEGRVQFMQQQVVQLPQLQQELAGLIEAQQRLLRDQQLQLQARQILESELADERAARAGAEEARAKAQSERTRLQLSRDELAAQVRVAQQKAADAVEEQLRSEEEAAVLRKELGLLQASSAMSAAVGAAATSGQPPGGGATDGAVLQTDLQALQRQVAFLMQALQDVQREASTSKAEAAQLRQRLADATQLHQKTTASPAFAGSPQHHKAGTPTKDNKVAPFQEQLRDQEIEHEALLMRVGEAEAQLARAHSQIIALQQQLAESETQAAALTTAKAGAATGSISIPQTPATCTGSSQVGDSDTEQVSLLISKIVMLKKSRDKLLAQMDKQSIELEQTIVENQALADSSTAMKVERDKWQSQAEDSFLENSQLQHLLAEGVTFQAEQSHRSGVADANTSTAGAFSTDKQPETSNLHLALQREQGRCALDLQVRVLGAQLLRACAAYRRAGRLLLPILTGLEFKLSSLNSGVSVCAQ